MTSIKVGSKVISSGTFLKHLDRSSQVPQHFVHCPLAVCCMDNVQDSYTGYLLMSGDVAGGILFETYFASLVCGFFFCQLVQIVLATLTSEVPASKPKWQPC